MTTLHLDAVRQPESRASWRAFARLHLLGLLVVLAGTAIETYVLTDGRAEFTRAEATFGGYYDALGSSMLEGRWDVPPEAIRSEAFLLYGRTYGYFGPTPALIRLPLNLAAPSMRGHWTRPMMMMSCFLTLFGTYIILQEARRLFRGGMITGIARQAADAFFIVCAALASPLFFIMHSPVIYHEASIVAVACAVWTFVFLLRYCEQGRISTLMGAFFCALASFQARGSVGVGPMLSVALIVPVLWIALVPQWPAWTREIVSHYLPSLSRRADGRRELCATTECAHDACKLSGPAPG